MVIIYSKWSWNISKNRIQNLEISVNNYGINICAYVAIIKEEFK